MNPENYIAFQVSRWDFPATFGISGPGSASRRHLVQAGKMAKLGLVRPDRTCARADTTSSGPTTPLHYTTTRGGLCRSACKTGTWKSRRTPPHCAGPEPSQCAALDTGTESRCSPTQTAPNAAAGPSWSRARTCGSGGFGAPGPAVAIDSCPGSSSAPAAATLTSPS